jgi:hypothetical protein
MEVAHAPHVFGLRYRDLVTGELRTTERPMTGDEVTGFQRRAAEERHMTQPAFSRRIRAL